MENVITVGKEAIGVNKLIGRVRDNLYSESEGIFKDDDICVCPVQVAEHYHASMSPSITKPVKAKNTKRKASASKAKK